MRSLFLVPFFALVLAAGPFWESVSAQRERIRLTPRRSTPVSASQASELTLTMTEAAVRPLQVWLRTAGTIDDSRTSITARLAPEEGKRLRVGQRVRAFSPQSRSRMHQATVSRVEPGATGVAVTVALMGRPLEDSRHFVLEIVTDGGELLSVPNEAVLESAGKQLVYVQEADGSYAPRDITVGVRGELFTQVLDGLKPGEQVVTIGSFFIDAEHRLKGF